MAASEVTIGYGVTFALSGDGGSTYTPVAEIYDLTLPSETVDIIDVTHSQSPDRTREFIGGLINTGECSFEMNFIPGSTADIALRANTGVQQCRVTFPNGVIWDFAGIKTGYEPTAPNDDKMTASVTFKTTSTIVSTPAP